MARIAMIVSNPCTADARVIKMARAAAVAGHEVHVFATMKAGVPAIETREGVTYHRLDWRAGPTAMRHPPFSWLAKVSRRLAGMAARRIVPFTKYRMFSEVYAQNVARVKPDLIHAHDLICLPAAEDAAKLCGARVVYDAHELEIHRNPPLPWLQKRWVSKLERGYAGRAEGVVAVGRFGGRVLGEHIGREDVTVLYNSPMISPCPRNIRDDLNIPADKPLLLYVGKVTMGRGVGEIVQMLPVLENVVFAAVGPSEPRTRLLLERQAERLKVANRFRILPPVPFDQVVSYIRGADLGVISVEPVTLSYQYCMPNKLFELAFAHVPIISNKLDEIEEFIGELDNGEIVELGEDPSVTYRISQMLVDKERYRPGPEAQNRLAEVYSWPAQVAKLLALYDKVLAMPGRSIEHKD